MEVFTIGHMLYDFVYDFKIGKSIETEIRLIVFREWGKGRLGVTANGYRIFVGEMRIFQN